MEIVIVLFLGAWVTVCGVIAYRKLRRDLRDDSGDGKE